MILQRLESLPVGTFHYKLLLLTGHWAYRLRPARTGQGVGTYACTGRLDWLHRPYRHGVGCGARRNPG